MTVPPPRYAVTAFRTSHTPGDHPTAGQIHRFDSWDALCAWVMRAPQRTASAKDGESIILGETNPAPWDRGPRRAPDALCALALDVDGFAGDWPAFLRWVEAALPGTAALVYSSWSHGLPGDKWQPGQSRGRVLLPLARPVSPAELRKLAEAVHRKLTSGSDCPADLDREASKDAARMWYTPRPVSPEHVEPLRVARVEGADLDPDAYRVRQRVELAEGYRADAARDREALASMTHHRPDLDPDDTGIAEGVDLVSLFREHGLLDRKNGSGWRTRCPWGHEHSDDKPDAADAQILDHPDGRHTWRCFHSSCEGRGARAVAAHLGVTGHATGGLRVQGIDTGRPRPVAERRAELRKGIAEALEGPEAPPVVFGAGVGVGKTRATLEAVLALFRPGGPLDDGSGIVWAAPTVALAHEAAGKLAELAKDAHAKRQIGTPHLLRVLDALLGDGDERRAVLSGRREGSCLALDAYRAADAEGPECGSRFCREQCPHGPGGRGADEADRAPMCPYMRSRFAASQHAGSGKPWIVFTTHAGYLCDRKLVDLDPYATIIDEAPASAMLDEVTFPPALLTLPDEIKADRLAADLELAARDPDAKAGHVTTVAEWLRASDVTVPSWEDARLADLDPTTRKATMHGLHWRQLDAVAEASRNGWPGARVCKGKVSVYRYRPWPRGRRTIVLDATATAGSTLALFGPEARFVAGATAYHPDTRVVALSGLPVTRRDLDRISEPERRVEATAEIHARMADAVARGWLIVMPSKGIVERWRDRPDEAPEWFRKADRADLVTWPNAEDARGSNRWESCPGVVSLTWTTPRSARLAYADALQRMAEIHGAQLDAEQADIEAIHALDTAPVIQAEGRVRPNNDAREIVRFSARGGAALVTPTEPYQRDALTVTQSAVDAFRRFGIVPSNRRGRALDRCAAIVLRRLADASGGVVVPHFQSPAIMRVFGVDRAPAECGHSSIGGSREVPDPPASAALAALAAASRSASSWARLASTAGLVGVMVTAVDRHNGRDLRVALDPARIHPDDERGIIEAVAEAIALDDMPHPWRELRYGRARVALDPSELIGLLADLDECPEGRNHLARLLGSGRTRANTLLRRCGGIEGMQRLWHRVHRADEAEASEAPPAPEPDPPPDADARGPEKALKRPGFRTPPERTSAERNAPNRRPRGEPTSGGHPPPVVKAQSGESPRASGHYVSGPSVAPLAVVWREPC